jgi:hypothetical protein
VTGAERVLQGVGSDACSAIDDKTGGVIPSTGEGPDGGPPTEVAMKTLAILAGGALLFVSSPAAANGRFPMANQIVFSSTDPQLIVLRTSYGILPSHDNGKTWQYVCEEALGISSGTLADPPIGLTRNNSLLAGVSAGLNVSPDVGCNWNCIGGPLAGQTITDLAVRPGAPSSAVAVTGTQVVEPDSGQVVNQSQVFETTDDGAHWAPLGAPIDPQFVVTTVEATKTDPNRLYVSAVLGFGSERTAFLFTSKDKGQTWVPSPLQAANFDPTKEEEIFIGGVDPTNADRVYLRSSGLVTGGLSRLTVATVAADGTAQFRAARLLDVNPDSRGLTGEMLGFALSSDGSKIFIGSNEDGLLMAEASDLVFHSQNAKIHVQCLATRGNELWACAPAVDDFVGVAGVSTDDGKTFTPKLRLIGALAGPIQCAPSGAGAACEQDANGSQCGLSYEAFCASNTCGPPPDPPPPPSSSCDLAFARGGGGAAGLGATLALVGVTLRRRRRGRASNAATR